ncbi:MAG: hypothetical protein WC451_05230 [Patescibacteria group bacterium]
MQLMRQNPAEVKRELEQAREELRGFLEERKIKENLLDLYDEKLYDAFQKGILRPELERLAHTRMTIQAEDRYIHERVQGQYNEVKLLLEQPKILKEDIGLLTEKIMELEKHILSMENRLAKLLK